MRRLRAAFVLSAAAAVACAVQVAAAGVDTRHDGFERALRELGALDTRLNEQVAESSLGIVKHYDDIVQTWAHIEALRPVLGDLPQHISAPSRHALREYLGRFGVAAEEKARLLERFKTEQAVLRNARKALPFSIEQLGGTGGDAPASMLNAVLLHALSPSPRRATAARCGLAQLRGDGAPGCAPPLDRGALSPDQQAQIDGVVRHGAILLERQDAVEALVKQLLTLPSTEQLRAAAITYDRAHADALGQEARRMRALELALGLTLCLGAAVIVTRTQRDARALKQLTEQLQDAMARLRVERDREKELARLKSRFVSMTSHEFRTPLSVIVSSVDLLLAYSARWDEARRHKHLKRIRTAGETMTGMIERVLLIGRADAELMELRPRPVDLHALVQEITDEVQTTLDEHRELVLVDEAPDEHLVLDEKLLRHVITNLLSNAFKYSPVHSPVHLRVGGDAQHACFEIRDQGIGIPPEDLPLLFEPFHRCRNAGDIPGTGLGLAIVKRSVERHGGRVQVESRPGAGTRFHVRIPTLGAS